MDINIPKNYEMGAINVQETPGIAEVSIPQGGSRAGTACGSSAGPL
jgi:hypothetical protein